MDRLPGANEAGCAEQIIAGRKMWGAQYGLYPLDRAVQYAVRLGRMYRSREDDR